jgi:hypothetical protein
LVISAAFFVLVITAAFFCLIICLDVQFTFFVKNQHSLDERERQFDDWKMPAFCDLWRLEVIGK